MWREVVPGGGFQNSWFWTLYPLLKGASGYPMGICRLCDRPAISSLETVSHLSIGDF
jgi:hypothetical protein